MTSPIPSGSTTPISTHKHALTAVEKQRLQLDRLLKDPQKPAYVPPPPKEKSVRAAREMMKNVQGSSAGAGSGEFHVYKASRRREYERLKIIEEQATKVSNLIFYEFEMKQLRLVRNLKLQNLTGNGGKLKKSLTRKRLRTEQSDRKRKSGQRSRKKLRKKMSVHRKITWLIHRLMFRWKSDAW